MGQVEVLLLNTGVGTLAALGIEDGYTKASPAPAAFTTTLLAGSTAGFVNDKGSGGIAAAFDVTAGITGAGVPTGGTLDLAWTISSSGLGALGSLTAADFVSATNKTGNCPPLAWGCVHVTGGGIPESFKMPLQVTDVPEPGSLVLLGIGVSGLGWLGRRKIRG